MSYEYDTIVLQIAEVEREMHARIDVEWVDGFTSLDGLEPDELSGYRVTSVQVLIGSHNDPNTGKITEEWRDVTDLLSSRQIHEIECRLDKNKQDALDERETER